VYWLTGIDTNPRFWWVTGLVLIIYGALGRLKDQGINTPPVVALLAALLFLPGMTRPPATEPLPVPPAAVQAGIVSESAFLDLGVPLIARWEGKRNAAYKDIVGVWTICYGHTRTARPGMVLSDAECTALLRSEVLEYRKGLHGYFTSQTKTQRLTPARDAAYTSLAFNVGIAGAGKSTATRRLNAGDIAGGCEALTWWNKAGGRVVRGLVRRRAEEREYCLRGLS